MSDINNDNNLENLRDSEDAIPSHIALMARLRIIDGLPLDALTRKFYEDKSS